MINQLNALKPQTLLLFAGAGILLFIAMRNAKSLGSAIGGGAVDLVTGTVGGAVVAIGKTVGIPETNQSQCKKCKAQNNHLCASKFCTASDFIAWEFSKSKQSGGATGSW